MPNATTVTLTPSAAVTSNGASSSVDIGTVRSLVRLPLVVTAVAGTNPTLDLTLETSADDASWEALDSADQIVTTGTYELIADRCKRYVRLAWTIGGTGFPSFTLTAVGEGHTLYATQDDLNDAHNPDALAQATQAQQLRALLKASDIADGYLSSAYTLPMASWGELLSSAVAQIAVYKLATGPVRQLFDDVVNDENTAARKTLRDIAEGRMRPATLVDSTPSAQEDGAYVTSAATRGW